MARQAQLCAIPLARPIIPLLDLVRVDDQQSSSIASVDVFCPLTIKVLLRITVVALLFDDPSCPVLTASQNP